MSQFHPILLVEIFFFFRLTFKVQATSNYFWVAHFKIHMYQRVFWFAFRVRQHVQYAESWLRAPVSQRKYGLQELPTIWGHGVLQGSRGPAGSRSLHEDCSRKGSPVFRWSSAAKHDQNVMSWTSVDLVAICYDMWLIKCYKKWEKTFKKLNLCSAFSN